MLRISRYQERSPIISTHVSRVDFRLSDKECGRTCSYSTCQGYNGQWYETYVTYFLRFSDPEQLCLKCTDFSTTYLSAQLLRKTYHFKGNQRIQRYTENTLHRRKIEMVNAPLLVQQFTHPVHPNSSYRLLYLLRQFVDKMGKIRNRQQTKSQEKNKQDSTQANISLSEKYWYHSDLPRSNYLFCSAAQAVVPCHCRIFVNLANSSRAAACCVVASLLSSIPTSG